MARIGRRRLIGGAAGLAAAGGKGRAAQAQAGGGTFPSRPVAIVVPFPPGGSTDLTARLLAERMAPRLGQPVVIENRPGAQTIVAAEHVARAAPDGHTLLMSSGTTLTINPVIGRNLPYRPEDFAPVALIATLPFALVVRQGMPATVEAFVALARSRPGGINYGHNGRGSFNHIAGAMIEEQLGIRLQDIPYRGDAAQMNDLLAGTLDAMVVGGATALAAQRAGRGARILAWTAERRLPGLPDVPVFAETHPNLVAQTWFGLLAPARTPPPAIARLNEAAQAALQDAVLRERLLGEGIVAAPPSGPERFAEFLRTEAARWEPLLRRLDIRLQ
ncbi:Bug family tripartite tricarboxylate transporter substrate binding protein [Caldovatus aquaticus]|uniref:Tripartite tricarboxylate transporter substrate binding protein n=1 Tax=Caldovatus aquaticus TaxID=2865671 RepID=A0ABS7F1L0_9PROT|nr:tripartite tricarboxylate transporter substrate binding protein [Caldovatus aquaticus]MBW8269501.1 tripartite tricarboxylate transporter substrate binding protein [Caldovatus aquaticus]